MQMLENQPYLRFLQGRIDREIRPSSTPDRLAKLLVEPVGVRSAEGVENLRKITCGTPHCTTVKSNDCCSRKLVEWAGRPDSGASRIWPARV